MEKKVLMENTVNILGSFLKKCYVDYYQFLFSCFITGQSF